MKVTVYNSEHKKTWNEFNKNSKNGFFMFDRDFMEYHADRFDDYSLMFFDDEKLLAILPANKKDGILYSHQGLTFGGFITDQNMKTAKMLECFAALKTFLFENNIGKMIYKAIPHIYHKVPAQEDLYALFRNDAKLFRVDVTTSIDNISHSYDFSELRKRGVKKALKNALEVRISDDFKSYHQILSNVLTANHDAKPVHSLEELTFLQQKFPDNIKLFASFKDGKMLAGVLIFENDLVAHAQYIACSNEGRELGALDLVFNYLIKEIYKNKKYFDFGISNEDSGKILNEGLISQKEGFGARAVAHQFFQLEINK